MATRFWKAGGNALLPGSNFLSLGAANFATFSTGATDKNANITLSAGNLHVLPGNLGNEQVVRATRAAQSGIRQFDTTLVGDGIEERIGVEDGTADVSPTGADPTAGGKGVALRFVSGSGWAIYDSGGFAQFSFNGGSDLPQAGDIYSTIIDTSGHTVTWYRTRSGTTIQLGTPYSITFTNYFAYVSGRDVAHGEVQSNFGQTSLVSTGSGASAY